MEDAIWVALKNVIVRSVRWRGAYGRNRKLFMLLTCKAELLNPTAGRPCPRKMNVKWRRCGRGLPKWWGKSRVCLTIGHWEADIITFSAYMRGCQTLQWVQVFLFFYVRLKIALGRTRRNEYILARSIFSLEFRKQISSIKGERFCDNLLII